MKKNVTMGMVLMLVSVGVFSGCVDVAGYGCCKNSYDNIDFGGNYTVVGHSSSFVSGAASVYFVTYNIRHIHGKSIIKVHGFTYDCETDELWHDGQDVPEGIVFGINS